MEVSLKVACVLIPHFPFMAEVQRKPQLKLHSLLIVKTKGSSRTVADFSPDLSGIRVGMPLQQALTFAREGHTGGSG